MLTLDLIPDILKGLLRGCAIRIQLPRGEHVLLGKGIQGPMYAEEDAADNVVEDRFPKRARAVFGTCVLTTPSCSRISTVGWKGCCRSREMPFSSSDRLLNHVSLGPSISKGRLSRES